MKITANFEGLTANEAHVIEVAIDNLILACGKGSMRVEMPGGDRATTFVAHHVAGDGL